MTRKVFSTIFTAILLTTVAVYQIDAGLSLVDDEDRFSITGSASIFQDAPTGNILRKYRQEGGQWVRFRTVKAKWYCQVTFSATVYGNGNADVLATGNAVHRADGSHFKTLWGDVNSERVSSWWFFNARETITAQAFKTIETDEESDVGSYKVTGTGYYKQAIGGDGLSVSHKVGGGVTVGGITSGTVSVPLEDDIPTFDIGIQCDPAAACENDNGDTDDNDGDGEDPANTSPVSPPTPSYHACGVHLTSVSGDHSWGTAPCGDDTHVGYLCQIDASDHEWVYESCSSGHAHYKCDGTDHSWVSFCFETDSNGQSCVTSGGYSACSPHTHTYPSPLVECAHTNCSEMVSSRTSHRTQCGSGQHYYWPGCPNNTNWWSQDSTHALRTCRYGTCGQTWYRCVTQTPYCSSPNRQGKKCWAQ